MKNHPLTQFVVIVAVLAYLQSASAQLPKVQRFVDTLTSPDFDNDLNNSASDRQSGLDAPIRYSYAAAGVFQIETGPDGLIFYPESNMTAVSPDKNFNQGGSFQLEFEVNPGLDDASHSSDDWAAVIFGSSNRNVFVNGSTGMGILFRNNGNIQVFDGASAIYSGDGGFDGGLPKDDYFSVRIAVTLPAFDGSPATVSLFINDEEANISGTDSPSYIKTSGFTQNYITLEGYAGGGNAWQHGFKNLSLSQEPCIELSPRLIIVSTGANGNQISLALPQSLMDAGASQISISSDNPAVAVIDGADTTGVYTLDVSASTTSPITLDLMTANPGQARLSAISSIGACVHGQVDVFVTQGSGFPETLLMDHFNARENSWDLNFELDGRQSGSLAPIGFLEGANTAAGGVADDLTQVNNDLYPGQLLILGQGNGVSPNHNFIEGTEFSVEAVVNPGPNNESFDSMDWSAIIIGASSPNRFVNSHDGFGVLFRNNRLIEVWNGNQNVYQSAADNPLPEAPYKVRLDARTANFMGSPAEIRLYINDQPYPLSSEGFAFVKTQGFYGNYITLAGIGDALDHVFDDLKITSVAGINFLDSDFVLREGETADIRVKVPEGLIENASAVVRVIATSPGVAVAQGATEGVLELTFAQGGPLVQTIPMSILNKGSGSFRLEGPAGVAVGPDLNFSISSAIVSNPSFESDPNPAFPGYGTVSEWQGFSGINAGNGPFHDNSTIPDRGQVAFSQGTRTAAQTIRGLTPGQKYWLQFYFNVRNCCGGSMNLSIQVDGSVLETISSIQPAAANPYYFRSLEFTPNSDEALIEFLSEASGDASLLMDAVTVVPAGEDLVTLANPSFEASGQPAAPGNINPSRLAGWIGEGTYGVNFSGAGPFADNGVNPDQDFVAFIQGLSSLTQTVNGLLSGQSYTLRAAVNARSGNAPTLKISAGGESIFEEAIQPVGGTNPYRVIETTFIANASSVPLRFEQLVDGDQSLLLDGISVSGESVNIPPVLLSVDALELAVGSSDGSFTITVPQLLIDNGDAVIRVISQNPDLAEPVGAVNGILEITFEQGGELSRLVEITSKVKGSTSFRLEGPPGIVFSPASIGLRSVGSLVRNPSFESNYNPTFPGYSPIDSWIKEGSSGNQGVNESGGPFHDNGMIPDRGRIGFIQVSNALHQNIHGLKPDQQYLLEFYYNTRNCCGGSIDLTVNFDGNEVDTILALQPVGAGQPYNYAAYVVVASDASARLEFATNASGDATALLDAVTLTPITENDIPVGNASFEASGRVAAFPGYIQPGPIAAWAMTGNYGINASGEGPFADNGANPDQDLVLFLQGEASATQTISGLTSGESYIIEVAANARLGNSPTLQVSANNSVVASRAITPVSGSNPYTKILTGFIADGESATISFAQTASGDNTLLLDHVRVYPGVPPKGAPELSISSNQNGVTIAWPADATGFSLFSAPKVNGPWTKVSLTPTIQGTSQSVTISPTENTVFFRLSAD